MKKFHTQELVVKANDKSISWEERAKQLIQVGLRGLDLELGIISHIENSNYTVLYSNNAELIGQEFQLGVTYCEITLSLTQTKVLAVEHFAVSDYFRHPAYKEFKLETYIGSPIIINGRRLGTINFTSPSKHLKAFTREEKEFTKTLSKAAAVLVLEAISQ